jgi:hypothetical protein
VPLPQASDTESLVPLALPLGLAVPVAQAVPVLSTLQKPHRPRILVPLMLPVPVVRPQWLPR